MKQVLVFRHVAHEGPGYCASFLSRRGIPYRLVCIDQGEPVPQSLDAVAGLVLMGGPMSVNDPLPWIPPLIALVQRAIAADLPVLGHCLGGQLLARALGAPVTPNPVQEIGWFPVRAVDGPRTREWLGGLPREFTAYHWHGETFTIPEGASRILESDGCPNQAFVLGPHLGLQCHVEMTPTMVADWAVKAGGRLRPSATVQSADEMRRDLERRTAELHRAADVLYGRWIQGLA
jgi:GMP synthase-like glutamine amidotransferase